MSFAQNTTRRSTCVIVAFLFAMETRPAGVAAEQGAPLRCVPAARDDGAPWIWNSRILESFPPDAPTPRFVGAFGDSGTEYELHLWRDAKGVFGQLLSPVLDADSLTSRLYKPHFDDRTGTLSFVAHFPDAERQFTGRLRPDSLTGTIVSAARTQTVVLRRLRETSVHGAPHDSYTSRAQFDCAMILFRTY
jgi:hypothetical protein